MDDIVKRADEALKGVADNPAALERIVPELRDEVKRLRAQIAEDYWQRRAAELAGEAELALEYVPRALDELERLRAEKVRED